MPYDWFQGKRWNEGPWGRARKDPGGGKQHLTLSQPQYNPVPALQVEKLKSREKTAQRKEKATWQTAQSTLSSPSLDPSPPDLTPCRELGGTTLCKALFSSGGCPSSSLPYTQGRPETRPGARGSAATGQAEGLAWLPLGLDTCLVICSWD